MLNIKNLLDQVISTTQTGASHTAPSRPSSLGSSLGGLLSNQSVSTGALAGIGGGGLLTALFSNNKTIRSLGGLGGGAALGTLALQAYRNWQTKNNVPESNTGAPVQKQPQSGGLDFDRLHFGVLPEAAQEERSRAILSAMVAAAKADGVFDARERQIILEEVQKMGDSETMAWVQQEIYKPLDLDEIAALATSPEMASEIYLASLIVIDEQNALEKQYLDLLATKMKLHPQLREEIERQVAA